MTSSDELTTVYTLRDAGLAEIIRIALEAEGIFCVIENEHQAGLTGVFDIDIQTRESDAERARELIEAHLAAGQADFGDEAEAYDGEDP